MLRSSRCNIGCGAMPRAARTACCASPRSRPTAAATWSAPPSSPATRACARLYLRHALDEQRHADLFRRRGIDLLRARPGRAPRRGRPTGWRRASAGSTTSRVERDRDGPLLAFLHLSEAAAARQFADLSRRRRRRRRRPARLRADPPRRGVPHELHPRRSSPASRPQRQGWLLWKARLGRLWKAYLRLAVGLAGVIGSVILTLQYFILLPPFAWSAKRAARREPQGWAPIAARAQSAAWTQ